MIRARCWHGSFCLQLQTQLRVLSFRPPPSSLPLSFLVPPSSVLPPSFLRRLSPSTTLAPRSSFYLALLRLHVVPSSCCSVSSLLRLAVHLSLHFSALLPFLPLLYHLSFLRSSVAQHRVLLVAHRMSALPPVVVWLVLYQQFSVLRSPSISTLCR